MTMLGDTAAELLSEQQLASFTRGYALALLWACTEDEDGDGVDPCEWQEPVYDWPVRAFDGDGQQRIRDDAAGFVAANREDLVQFSAVTGTDWPGMGHDLALTRNGCGAGFWDRGAGDVGDRLSGAARALGEVHGSVAGSVVSLA